MQQKNREFSFLKQKILQFLDYKGIKKSEFYEKVGISNGILSQNNGLSEENLLRILNYFPEINPNWLISGNGSMLRDYNKTDNLVCEQSTPYGSVCKNCIEKDKLIATLEKLNKSQSRTIELLEDKINLNDARIDNASVAGVG